MKFELSTLLLLLSASVGAQKPEEVSFKHPLTDMPGPSEDVITSSYFPQHTDKRFPTGENVVALCHFSNEGSGNLNISAIMGSLNAPFDFSQHYQNYSYKPFGIVVGAGEEISLKYNFQLHPELDPVEYQLAITVFYESETEAFSTTFFNQTVELYSPNSEYDLESVGSVAYSLIFTAVVVLVTYLALVPDSKLMKVIKSKITEAGSSSSNAAYTAAGSDDGWTKVESKKKKRKAAKDAADE